MLKQIICYITGYYRYHIYYHFPELLKFHILGQIKFRIFIMNEVCLSRGSCVKCGCRTTALQMCKDVCEGNCYPPFMKAKEWIHFLNGGVHTTKEGVWNMTKDSFLELYFDGKLVKSKFITHEILRTFLP